MNITSHTTSVTKSIPIKFKGVWLTLDELFDIQTFIDHIIQNLEVRVLHQILIKIRYNAEEFAMLDKQFAFTYENYTDYNSFNELRDIITNRLFLKLEQYRINESDVLLVQILHRNVVYGDLDKLKIDIVKPKLSKSEFTNVKTISAYFPLTFDLVEYGKPLKVISSDNIVKSVMVPVKNYEESSVDFIENFNKNNISLPNKIKSFSFDPKQQFYHKIVSGISIIIVIDIQGDNKQIRKAYTLQGVYLGGVEDTKVGDIYIRRFGNNTFFVQNNNIIYLEKTIDLKPIKRELHSDIKTIIEDVRIGVIDIETYTENNLAKVYALGFLTNLDTKPNLYYIEAKNLNSSDIILNCINEMLRSKYKGITFYAHNLGNFDSVFIIKAILEYNKKLNNTSKSESEVESPYILKTVCRDDVILKLTIKRKIGDTLHSLSILDSYRILTHSLHDLAGKYEVEIKKGCFPHKFSGKDTLFYIGETPNINYYNRDVTPEQYKEIKKDIWNFKEESLDYLSKDLRSLYQILVKVNRTLFLDLDVCFTKCLTISKLAFEVFSKDYLSIDKPIPLINKKGMYRDLKLGYYGGNTEVYRPYGENLYYYDVNSLYPYVSLNDMVGLQCCKQDYINLKADLEDLFGFFYCEVKAPTSHYLGLLPLKTKTGIIFPVGVWSGMYFSEELKFAAANGYQVNIKWGYKFNRVSNVFTDYVNSLYRMKSHPKNITQKNLAKSLLNNLLGRFGMDINKPVTEIVDNKTFNELSLTRRITNKKDITDDDILVTYSPDIDQSVCVDFGIDFIEALKQIKVGSTGTFKGVSVPISAAITAYGRIHMSKIKLDILNKGGKIYYNYTDSIVTDINLSSDMIDAKLIGKLKLENEIKEAYFISGKTYYLVLKDGGYIQVVTIFYSIHTLLRRY